MKSNKILISGYYGFDNFGDDAILHTILSNIKDNIENSQITVISKNPDKTKQNYCVDSVYTFNFKEIFHQMRTSDLFISGGGSLLQDVTSFKSLLYYLGLIFLAKLLNIKTYIYAQGIGPINNKTGQFLTGLILKKVDLITVRDQESKDFLSNLGINSNLTADPVWNINVNRENENNLNLNNQKIKVGIQLRNWDDLDDKKLNCIVNAVNRNFNHENAQIILISLQDSHDLAITKRFEKFLKSANPNHDVIVTLGHSISDNIDLISQLDYLIAMRYHANLISIKFNIPTLALSYDPKVESLSKETQIPFISISKINEEELNDKICNLITEKSVYKDRLKDFSAKKEQESRQNIDLLVKMLFDGKIVRD